MGGGRGTGSGVDPAFASAPVNPMNLPRSAFNAPGTAGSAMGYHLPSMASQIVGRAGQYANALQPLFNAIPGQQGQPQQQQQQRPQPVNFNVPYQPYIPPPGGGQNGY